MRIFMVSPEIAPYAKVGGLADVVGALPKVLAEKGHDVRIVIPLYGCVKKDPQWKSLSTPLAVHLGHGTEYCRVWEGMLEGSSNARIYFLEHNQYFGRHEIYSGPWGDHKDNGERFCFLSRAAIDLCYYLNWIPDVIHCHDWTNGLVPVYLNTTEKTRPLAHTATVFTIHNMEHQGVFNKNILSYAGLPDSVFVTDGLEAYGHINMLKGGLYHATKLTTVSPNYAQEIQTHEYGCGLSDVLRFRAADLIGVLNGIDTQHWNPKIDPYLPECYGWDNPLGKVAAKKMLQHTFKLDEDIKIPIFCTVSRLFHQKGLDVLVEIMDRLMANLNIQLVALGTGDSSLEHAFIHFTRAYKGRVGTYIGYDNQLAHLIKGGSDFFIMPSRFEPCGLAQLYAMVYGALPIVRATGGLVDTVRPYQAGENSATGFLFNELTPDALYDTICKAYALYCNQNKDFEKIQIAAMKQDFSWGPSAQKYEAIYSWAIQARRHG